jgi:uncharacterized membrane protein
MLENVGKTDRWLRAAVGSSLVLAGLGGARRGGLASALALGAGVMLLETAITRVCPVNHWLGIDTRFQNERRLEPSPEPKATEVAEAGPRVSEDGAPGV